VVVPCLSTRHVLLHRAPPHHARKCRYDDRGLIPRSLSRIFAAFKDRTDCQFSAYISYLEIYNEAGYDLLDPSHESKTLEELP